VLMNENTVGKQLRRSSKEKGEWPAGDRPPDYLRFFLL
jgi:hypothetical protein